MEEADLIYSKILENAKDMKKNMNDKEAQVPLDVKKVFNKLYLMLIELSKKVGETDLLFFYLYSIMYTLYVGEDCALESVDRLQECIRKHDSDDSDELNLYDEKGRQITLKELGIEQEAIKE